METNIPDVKSEFLRSRYLACRSAERYLRAGAGSEILEGVLCLVNVSLSTTDIILYTSHGCQKDENCVSG